MAKAPKTSKAATPKAKPASKPKAGAKAAAPKKPKAKKVEVAPEPIFHHSTRLFYNDDAGRLAIEEVLPLVDAVVGLGRVLITSVAISAGKISLHAALPGSPAAYTEFPGVILTIDPEDSSVAFDHHIIGYDWAELIDDAAFTLLEVIKDEGQPHGRRADWYKLAVAAIDDIYARHSIPKAA